MQVLSTTRQESSLPVHWNSDWIDKLSASFLPRVSFTYELHLSFIYSSVWNGQNNGANTNQLKSADSVSTIIPGVTFKTVTDTIQRLTYCSVESVSEVCKGVHTLIMPGDILLKVNDALVFDMSEPSMISPSSILATVQPMSTSRILKILRVPPSDPFPSKIELKLLAGTDSPAIAKVKMQPISDQTPAQYNLAILAVDNQAPAPIRRSLQGAKVFWETPVANPLGSANLPSNHCVTATLQDGSTSLKEGVFRDPRGRFLAIAFLPLPPLDPEDSVTAEIPNTTTTTVGSAAGADVVEKSVSGSSLVSIATDAPTAASASDANVAGKKRERSDGDDGEEAEGTGADDSKNVTEEAYKVKKSDRQKTRKVAFCVGKFNTESEAVRAYKKAKEEVRRTGKYCLRRPTVYPWDQAPLPGQGFNSQSSSSIAGNNKPGSGNATSNSTYIIPMLSTSQPSASSHFNSGSNLASTFNQSSISQNKISYPSATGYNSVSAGYSQPQYQPYQQYQPSQSQQYPQQQQQQYQQFPHQQSVTGQMGGYTLAGPPTVGNNPNPGAAGGFSGAGAINMASKPFLAMSGAMMPNAGPSSTVGPSGGYMARPNSTLTAPGMNTNGLPVIKPPVSGPMLGAGAVNVPSLTSKPGAPITYPVNNAAGPVNPASVSVSAQAIAAAGGKKGAVPTLPQYPSIPTNTTMLGAPGQSTVGAANVPMATNFNPTNLASNMFSKAASTGVMNPSNSGMLTLNMNNVQSIPRPNTAVAPVPQPGPAPSAPPSAAPTKTPANTRSNK